MYLKRKGSVTISLICVILGFMLAVQFKSTDAVKNDLRFVRVEDITARLNTVEKERDQLLNEYRELTQGPDGQVISSQESLLRMGAGMTSLRGPGVILSLNDSKLASQPGKDLFFIRDEDILKILNELKAAGAEAISINDQRLVAPSGLRYSNRSLTVNNVTLMPPFEIRAIGDPVTLENSLRMRGGVLETIQVWGIDATVKKQDTVDIPEYKGTYHIELAKPTAK